MTTHSHNDIDDHCIFFLIRLVCVCASLESKRKMAKPKIIYTFTVTTRPFTENGIEHT